MSLYLEHFNLRELPFRITPAVDFFYRGCVRGETLDAIQYAIGNGEGLVAVIGEVGNGKSMLCRMLMKALADQVELVYIANPSFSDQEIIYHIAEELGMEISSDNRFLARDLQNRLLELHSKGRRIIVCIDEAQAIPDSSLEQIRLLSNLETATEKVVQIVLFGQPELAAKLEQRHMRQLRERITSSFNLRKLNNDEVHEYIHFRLKQASLADRGEIFSKGACNHIAKVSQGISRRINILCDKAMLAAFAANSDTVTTDHAKKAARDARYRRMEDDRESQSEPLLPRKTWLAAGVAVAAIAAIAYQNLGSATTAQRAEPAAQQAQAAPPAQQAQAQPATQRPPAQQSATASPAAPAAPANTAVAPAPRPPAALADNPRWQAFPPNSYVRRRLNATETLFGIASDPNQYTARLLTVPRQNIVELERYLRDLARFYSVRNVMVYPSAAQGEQIFVVTYGSYPSEFQAELFIHELPSFFRDNKPFVQALAVSQLEAAQNW